VRLAPRIAEARFGSRPVATARLLVLAESSTNRRRLERMSAVIDAAYPDRGPDIRAWLRAPVGRMAGVLFVAGAAERGTRSRRRVRHPSRAAQ
jgi:hypothetical protein